MPMTRVTLADAKANLSALVEQAAHGDAVLITRRGKEVAQITSVDRPLRPVDLSVLRAFTDAMPAQPESARQWMRRVRDEERF